MNKVPNLPSQKMKFLHLGIACEDIAVCKDFIKTVMNVVREGKTVFDKNQNASVCLLTLPGGFDLELISGPVVANILKKGMTYYHTCYGVNNLEETVSFLKRKYKVTVISEIKLGKVFNGRRVVFLYTPIGIIELLED